MSAAFESEELLVLLSIFGEDCISYQPADAEAVSNGGGRGESALLMFHEPHQGKIPARRGLSSVSFHLPPGYPVHVPTAAAGADVGTGASAGTSAAAGGEFEFDIALHGCAPKVCASSFVFHASWFIVRHPHPSQHPNNTLTTHTCPRGYTAKCAPPCWYVRTAHNSPSFTFKTQTPITCLLRPPYTSNTFLAPIPPTPPYPRRPCWRRASRVRACCTRPSRC